MRGFLTASLLFCVGPMAILGSIQDGLTGDYNLLAVKSVLDGFASLAFASSLGVGVAFSVLPILVYQGSISLLASQVQAVTTSAMITEMTAALDEKARERLVADIPMRRTGTAEEIAEVIWWVAGSTYMTGAVIPTDGGLMAAL